MFNCLNIKLDKAMTLIEVLVVMAILIILISVVIINPRPSLELDQAASQLAADIRRAQNMSMSAVEQDPDPVVDGDEYVPCGYGINYSSGNNYYVLFGDFAGDLPDDIDCLAANNSRNGDGSEDIETIYFDSDTIALNSTGDIVFLAPKGTPSGQVTITIRDSSGSTKQVIVTSSGNIEVQ